MLLLVLVVIGGGLKMAGMRLPIVDYPVGPIGSIHADPAMPNIQLEAPGFDEFDTP